MRKTGTYETLGNLSYFLPDPLPPQNPPLALGTETSVLYGEVMHHLGKLNEIADRLPDAKRFIKAYIVKEALLSSAIEGIHTTLLDVFTQPISGSKPNKNTQLVMNYTKALDWALSMVKDEKLPIVSRVILGAHEVLMQVGEGDKANPGQYRKQAVRVGNHVPPQATKIPELMSQLERFINTDETLPPLIKAGLVHVQFETIHPFLDGNGRIGRLLIVLTLVERGLLSAPIIYPSYYFKKHQLEYYQRLDGVRTLGDFEGWIVFYLSVIKDSSIDAFKRIKEIEALVQELTHCITGGGDVGKIHETRLRALSVIFGSPVIDIKELSLQLKVSYNTASQIVIEFIKLGILVEETKQKRNRLFKFKRYFDVLEREFE